jgi:DNA-binding NarL/FixJ family response regulator
VKVWTVFILYDHPLFAWGLEGLLQREQGLRVEGVAPKSEGALAQIRTLNPDVVIVEAEKGMPERCWLLSRLLQEQPQARVIRVSLEDNTATLYTSRCWTANRVEDLIRGILDPTVPSPTSCAEQGPPPGSPL